MLGLAASPTPDESTAGRLAALALELDRLGDAVVSEGPALLRAAVDMARASGAESLSLEVEPATPAHAELAATSGMARVRELLQLRRTLPLPEKVTLAVRTFEPGRDEAAWLDVNNRAFRWHPEQGNWTIEDLLAREREPWFDPDGFFLHEREGRLAGSCWTKIHREHDPPLGEIYVIAVDPDFHGLGLGRALTLIGLDWLARQGLSTAMLYVEADNEPARRLYGHLGFDTHHARCWFTASLYP
jgi:mycothiol synthase